MIANIGLSLLVLAFIASGVYVVTTDTSWWALAKLGGLLLLTIILAVCIVGVATP